MTSQTSPTSALEELNQWVEQEKRENGLKELGFMAGSDANVMPEEVAQVALAMLRCKG